MRIQGHRRCIEITTPAKVNLFLEVLGRRADGYHDIDTLMCPISLCDELIIEATSAPGIELELQLPEQVAGRDDDPAWRIPSDDRNLVVRGVQRLQRRLGTSSGCHIRLNKSIPAQAGLGGGSSNAAAAICGCLIAWDRWNRQLATDICAEIGSDVPFFLGSPQGCGLARARGRGEICEPLSAQPALAFMLTHPPAGCSTQQVYAGFQQLSPPRDIREIIDACEAGEIQKIGARLFNALQSSAALLTPWIERQLEIFSQQGVRHSLMTGSGSSCFALLPESSATRESSAISRGEDFAQHSSNANMSEERSSRSPLDEGATTSSNQLVERIQRTAEAAGLSRVYSVQACYEPSIEFQTQHW